MILKEKVLGILKKVTSSVKILVLILRHPDKKAPDLEKCSKKVTSRLKSSRVIEKFGFNHKKGCFDFKKAGV